MLRAHYLLFMSHVSDILIGYKTMLCISDYLNLAMDSKIAKFLNRSCDKVPILPGPPYIVTFGYLDINWQIYCDAHNTNFSCTVRTEKLRLCISKGTTVNEF